MECITSSSIPVLLNGIPVEQLKLERVIWQGDLISPSIFIMCAKYLGRYMHFIANVPKSCIGIMVTKDGPTIL